MGRISPIQSNKMEIHSYLFFVRGNQIATCFKENTGFNYISCDGQEFWEYEPTTFWPWWKSIANYCDDSEVDFAFLTDSPFFKIVLSSDFRCVAKTSWRVADIKKFLDGKYDKVPHIFENGVDLYLSSAKERFYLTRFNVGEEEVVKTTKTSGFLKALKDADLPAYMQEIIRNK